MYTTPVNATNDPVFHRSHLGSGMRTYVSCPLPPHAPIAVTTHDSSDSPDVFRVASTYIFVLYILQDDTLGYDIRRNSQGTYFRRQGRVRQRRGAQW